MVCSKKNLAQDWDEKVDALYTEAIRVAKILYQVDGITPMHILLETERLILRRFTESDARPLFDLDNDRDVMRYINGGTPTAFDVVENELLPSFLRYDELLPVFGFWAMVEKNTLNFVGWVSLRFADENPLAATLGYRLRKAAWGMGYATEGARALIDAGFRMSHIERVIATTYEENLASQRVMEKLGMTLVRRFRITADDLTDADTYHASSLDLWDGDDLEYALTRMEWAAR